MEVFSYKWVKHYKAADGGNESVNGTPQSTSTQYFQTLTPLTDMFLLRSLYYNTERTAEVGMQTLERSA